MSVKSAFSPFTEVGYLGWVDLKRFLDVQKMIKSEKDENKLEDTYRILASLMQTIIIKRKKLWGVKRISIYYLFKKLGIWKKIKRGDIEPEVILGIWKRNPDVLKFDNLFDHCYAERWKSKSEEGNNEILWLEPYHFSKRDMKELIEFCDKNRLNCWVGRTAEHFPNETIKIGVCKIKNVRN